MANEKRSKRDQVDDLRMERFEDLGTLAKILGYKSPFQQLTMNNGTSVSDVIEMFEDNPGMMEAVAQWAFDNHPAVQVDDEGSDDEWSDDEG